MDILRVLVFGTFLAAGIIPAASAGAQTGTKCSDDTWCVRCEEDKMTNARLSCDVKISRITVQNFRISEIRLMFHKGSSQIEPTLFVFDDSSSPKGNGRLRVRVDENQVIQFSEGYGPVGAALACATDRSSCLVIGRSWAGATLFSQMLAGKEVKFDAIDGQNGRAPASPAAFSLQGFPEAVRQATDWLK
jgi:hypothetical protein